MENNETFWLNDPNVLFKFIFIPTHSMTDSEKLNALTRTLIVVCILLYFSGFEYYSVVFIIGLIFILVLKSGNRECFRPPRGNCNNECLKETTLPVLNTKYEAPDVYYAPNYDESSFAHAHYKVIPQHVPPPYVETWRNKPDFTNEFGHPQSYDMVSNDGVFPIKKTFFDDETWVSNTPINEDRPRVRIMPAVESAFMRDSLEFRNNIMGDYVDQIERTRQHNCIDFRPGRKTW